jgi:hypothetical protein
MHKLNMHTQILLALQSTMLDIDMYVTALEYLYPIGTHCRFQACIIHRRKESSETGGCFFANPLVVLSPAAGTVCVSYFCIQRTKHIANPRLALQVLLALSSFLSFL